MNADEKVRPDFDALRAERNRQMDAFAERWRAEGFDVGQCALQDKDACYCACYSGGPCEHVWDGKPYEDGEGMWSTTCSRCGLTAFSHSMRNCP